MLGPARRRLRLEGFAAASADKVAASWRWRWIVGTRLDKMTFEPLRDPNGTTVSFVRVAEPTAVKVPFSHVGVLW